MESVLLLRELNEEESVWENTAAWETRQVRHVSTPVWKVVTLASRATSQRRIVELLPPTASIPLDCCQEVIMPDPPTPLGEMSGRAWKAAASATPGDVSAEEPVKLLPLLESGPE
jgi:hypothetical protein